MHASKIYNSLRLGILEVLKMIDDGKFEGKDIGDDEVKRCIETLKATRDIDSCGVPSWSSDLQVRGLLICKYGFIAV